MFKANPKPSDGPKPKKPIRIAPWIKTGTKLLLLAALIFAAPMLFAAHGVKLALLVLLPEGQKRSGKSGTVVWNKNNTMRVFAFPALVRNSYTTFVRSTLADFSSAWRNLTQSEQNGWINAKGITTKNRVGTFNETSGKTLYVKLNFNLAQLGVAGIDDAPSPVAVPSPIVNVVPLADLSDTKIVFTFNNTDAALGNTYEATTKLSFGVNRPKENAFRVIAATDDSTSPISETDLWDAYETKFGALAVGDCFFMRATYISNVTGQQSVSSQVYKIIVVA